MIYSYDKEDVSYILITFKPSMKIIIIIIKLKSTARMGLTTMKDQNRLKERVR